MNGKLLSMTIVSSVGACLSYIALNKHPDVWGWIAFMTIILVDVISETDCDCNDN